MITIIFAIVRNRWHSLRCRRQADTAVLSLTNPEHRPVSYPTGSPFIRRKQLWQSSDSLAIVTATPCPSENCKYSTVRHAEVGQNENLRYRQRVLPIAVYCCAPRIVENGLLLLCTYAESAVKKDSSTHPQILVSVAKIAFFASIIETKWIRQKWDSRRQRVLRTLCDNIETIQKSCTISIANDGIGRCAAGWRAK